MANLLLAIKLANKFGMEQEWRSLHFKKQKKEKTTLDVLWRMGQNGGLEVGSKEKGENAREMTLKYEKENVHISSPKTSPNKNVINYFKAKGKIYIFFLPKYNK